MGMGRPSYRLELVHGCVNGYGQAMLQVRVGGNEPTILCQLLFLLQSLQYSKTLNRNAERELLHKVSEAECDLLVERWQSQECINAIMSFFSKKESKL